MSSPAGRLVNWLDRRIKVVFLLPAVALIVMMILFPLLFNFGLSFTKWSMSSITLPRFVGILNYINLLKDTRFLMAVARTLIYCIVCLVIEVVAGVGLAVYLKRDFAGRSIMRTAVLLPVVMTPVTVGMIWLLVYEPTIGLANSLLGAMSIHKQLWLGSQGTALPSLMIVDIWECAPEITLITLAGLYALSLEPYEAAMVDGARPWQIVWRITLPMIMPTIAIAAMLRIIDVLKTFDIIYSTTGGGPGFSTENMNILAYLQGFQYFQVGTASAILVLYFLIILCATLLMLRLKNRFVLEM